MAEEDTTKPTTTNGEATVKGNGGKQQNRSKQKTDQKPIEELYDLTKPIPRVRMYLLCYRAMTLYVPTPV
jgi:hypothetical protein